MKKQDVSIRLARGVGRRTHLGAILCGALFLSGTAVFLFGQGFENRKVTEVFHVGKVGQRNAAETRETLMAIFQEVAKAYNERIKQEQSSNPQIFKGERVRVIKRILEQDDHGELFLVAYNGGPSVLSLGGDSDLTPGDLSPPLIISEAGQHTMEVTRRVRIPDKKRKKPALEVVDESSGTGGATFFGIPVGGPVSSSGGGGSTSSSGPTYKTVTDTNTLKKFKGIVSSERSDGAPQQMSTAVFVRLLKNGEIFTASRTEERRCQECGGFGRVTATTKYRDADGKMPCPDCREAGKLEWDVTYQVFW